MNAVGVFYIVKTLAVKLCHVKRAMRLCQQGGRRKKTDEMMRQFCRNHCSVLGYCSAARGSDTKTQSDTISKRRQHVYRSVVLHVTLPASGLPAGGPGSLRACRPEARPTEAVWSHTAAAQMRRRIWHRHQKRLRRPHPQLRLRGR